MLKKTIIPEILGNKRLLIALMDHFNMVHHQYLRSLIRANDPRFTQTECLQLIASYLKKEVDELICILEKKSHANAN